MWLFFSFYITGDNFSNKCTLSIGIIWTKDLNGYFAKMSINMVIRGYRHKTLHVVIFYAGVVCSKTRGSISAGKHAGDCAFQTCRLHICATCLHGYRLGINPLHFFASASAQSTLPEHRA